MTRINLGYDYGTVATLSYRTNIVVDGGGSEQRNPEWSQPLLKFRVAERVVNRAELDYLLALHEAAKGSLYGFEYRDWSDYYVDQLIAVGDGNRTQFQLVKTYTVAGYSVRRPITKPCINPGDRFDVYVGNAQVFNFEVHPQTGIITFTNPPVGDIWVDCEFDVPVRFADDDFEFRFEAIDSNAGEKLFTLSAFDLLEIRDVDRSPIEPIPQALPLTINLGVDLRTAGGAEYETTINTTGAGFEQRVANWDNPRGKYNIGDRTLSRLELDYFISFFRVARGAAVSFYFKDWQTEEEISVRFGEDGLSYRFDAMERESGKVIYNLGGTTLVKTTAKTSYNQYFSRTFDGSQLTTFNFTINAPAPVVAWGDAQIYLVAGNWDDCGTIGSYSPPCVPGEITLYAGEPISIGTGLSVSGSVQNLIAGSCGVEFSLLWVSLAI